LEIGAVIGSLPGEIDGARVLDRKREGRSSSWTPGSDGRLCAAAILPDRRQPHRKHYRRAPAPLLLCVAGLQRCLDGVAWGTRGRGAHTPAAQAAPPAGVAGWGQGRAENGTALTQGNEAATLATFYTQCLAIELEKDSISLHRLHPARPKF